MNTDCGASKCERHAHLSSFVSSRPPKSSSTHNNSLSRHARNPNSESSSSTTRSITKPSLKEQHLTRRLKHRLHPKRDVGKDHRVPTQPLFHGATPAPGCSGSHPCGAILAPLDSCSNPVKQQGCADSQQPGTSNQQHPKLVPSLPPHQYHPELCAPESPTVSDGPLLPMSPRTEQTPDKCSRTVRGRPAMPARVAGKSMHTNLY